MSITASSAALAKLEPFLLLAKNVRGSAAAKLIEEATAAPGCYVFCELLECEGIAELANSAQYEASHRKLQSFAFGDLLEYHAAAPGTYPSLTEAQLIKLRHLTLVSLATHSRSLSYSTLQPALGLGSESGGLSTDSVRGEAGPSTGKSMSATLGPRQIRQLEDIIIDAMYAGVLSGRLDQRMQRLEVDGVMGRDVRGNAEIGKLATALQDWSSITDHLLQMLQARINETRKADEARSETRNAHNVELKKMLLSLNNRSGAAGGLESGAPGGRMIGMSAASGGTVMPGISNGTRYDRLGSDKFGDMMDIDDDAGSRRKKAGGTGPMRSKRSRP